MRLAFWYRIPVFLFCSTLCALGAPAQTLLAPAQPQWIATWATSQQIPEPGNALAPADLHDATLRQIVHISVGGTTLRVHLSNAFGTDALHLTSVHIAVPLAADAPAIDPGTDKPLSFNGAADVTIPPGAEYVSDPVDFLARPLSSVAISFHLDDPPARETGHPGSRATSYYVHGDVVSAANLTGPGADLRKVDHWYQISEIDVQASAPGGAVVALGDSTTDGHGATTNGNDRWTDVLAARLEASPAARGIGVANAGIGGNHLLTDGLGPNALARFDRDGLAPSGVRWLIVFEGVNDLGSLAIHGEVPPPDHAALVQRILGVYQQMILRAHAHGLRVIGATITPFSGSDYYHPSPAAEADRRAINQWIRAAGHFDAVVDFDQVVRDPSQLDHLLPAFDCGDHLHPSPAGYKAMGDAIPLTLFAQ